MSLVFIPRAFKMIGQALFGDQWSGVLEGYAQPAKPPPLGQDSLTSNEIDLIERLLRDRPGFKGRNPPRFNPFSGTIGGLGGMGGMPVANDFHDPNYQPFEDGDWVAAREIFEADVARKKQAIERRQAVVEWLIKFISDERKLRVIVRDAFTGQQILGPPEHWNFHWDQLEGRWHRGRYFLQAPVARPGVSREGWTEVEIYVVENDLRALLKLSNAGDSNADELPSPRPAAKKKPVERSGDVDLVGRIKRARHELDQWKKANPTVTSHSLIAKAVAQVPGVDYGWEALRQILRGDHPPSLRLQGGDMLTPWPR